MAKVIIVKGVTELQLGGMMEGVVDNNGTFIKHSTDNLNFEAVFPTDADCTAFYAAAILINPLYANADFDPLQALNVLQGKT